MSDTTVDVIVDDNLNKLHINVQAGEMLIDVLRKSGKYIRSECGGKGTCGKCLVEIPGVGQVLSCQYKIKSSISVLISTRQKARILESAEMPLKEVINDSGIKKDKDNEYLKFTFNGREIHLKETGDNSSVTEYGIAVDVGTTTVVIYLENLADYKIVDAISFINPQVSFGSDVISRINHTIENKNGLKMLQKRLLDAINTSLDQMCSSNCIKSEHIFKAEFAGNTIMLHLLLGVNPASIASAPYKPEFVEERNLSADMLGLRINPKGFVKILPSLSGYVGADIIAGIAATNLADTEKYSLFIDIGTNGEIALGNKHVVFCCAAAAGPAFEGARIQCGTGGVEGAISHYYNGRYETIGNKKPVGICGSGVIDIIAYLLETGKINTNGQMKENFILEYSGKTAVNGNIFLTPRDVSEIQLAKAAIYAGIKILIKEAGVVLSQIENVFLAGGFGNFMDPQSAVKIGLIPFELREKIFSVGNSAGAGARLSLRSVHFNTEIHELLNKAKYVELSMRTDFNDEYVDAMVFPVFNN
ncbi:MAG: ASKHA domain-containing protein [bacterium]